MIERNAWDWRHADIGHGVHQHGREDDAERAAFHIGKDKGRGNR